MTTIAVITAFLAQNVRLAVREGALQAIPTSATIQIHLYWNTNGTRPADAVPVKGATPDVTVATAIASTTTARTIKEKQNTPSAPFVDPANTIQSSLATADGGAPSSTVVYSALRPDRSGAVILDMLFAHAFAYSKNWTYMGACDRSNRTGSHTGRNGTVHPSTHREDAHELIKAVGLDKVLRFDCPPDEAETSSIMAPKTYVTRNLKTFTSHYLEHVRSQVRYPPRRHGRRAVVHVRRGDVTPCSYYSNRYLPNSHYVDIINEILPRNVSVTVLSESDAFESPAADFAGHEVLIDSDLSEAWLAMMTADHVVLSKSSFSFVPALLNSVGNVYYTPFLKPKLPGWITVPRSIQSRSRARVRAMIHERCHDEEVKKLALRRLGK
jgi:hypothetical protein